MSAGELSLTQAEQLPRWRQPEALLMLMAFAMPLAFAVWMVLFNNFVKSRAGFDGADVGMMQTIREIPGFLSFLVVYLLLVIREQTLAILSLFLLGVGVAATGYFPSWWGVALTTFVGSIGFHYYETVNQSLQMQWLSRQRAPMVMGRLVAVASAANLLSYGLIMLLWQPLQLDYTTVYLAGGLATCALAVVCWAVYPRFQAPATQHRKLVLRRRYWLYYAIVFLSGARRQIFVVFAAWLMVERFGYEVHQVTALFLINFVANMVVGPLTGRIISRWGERRAMSIEYTGLALVFVAYAVVDNATAAAVLYVIDHLFFAMSFAQRTYFQKIADPKDIAPTAAVAFTINHIAAVALPVLLGLLWLWSPAAVFLLGAALALCSLGLVQLIPRDPAPGRETTLVPA